MRIAITGAAGRMGHGLVEVFGERHTVLPITRAEADLTDRKQVFAAFERLEPECVVHAAAIPDLDLCESEPALAYLVNVHATRHVVEAARASGIAVAQISTDAVFDGKKQSPYVESDPTSPPTVYGRTKLRAERIVGELPEHFIFRVSILFGPDKNNFVERGLQKLERGEAYVTASDQRGNATYTVDAARAIRQVVEGRRYGLYHLSNQGACTREELARRAATLAGLDARLVIGKPSGEMGRRATRLKDSVMEMRALAAAGFEAPRPWPEALAEYIHRRRTGSSAKATA